MLTKAFYNFGGVWAAASEAPRSSASANPDMTRKPSNLVVRAALKRKRLATAATTKPEPEKPS